MILVDTGPLVAFANKDDPLHARAYAALEDVWGGKYGAPFSTDYVLDEGMTVLMTRVGRKDVSEAYAGLFESTDGRALNPMVTTPLDVLHEALETHLRHFDRKLSFTDATLVAHARRRGAKILTFDRGFDGYPAIERVH